MSGKTKIQKLKAKDYGFKPFQKMPDVTDKKFSKFHDSMFESKAWKAMSIHSRYLYVEMSRKYIGTNHDNIMFLQKEGEQLMGKNTFISCIDELIRHGFIEMVEHHQHTRFANIYGFIPMWTKFGTSHFHYKPRNPDKERKFLESKEK